MIFQWISLFTHYTLDCKFPFQYLGYGMQIINFSQYNKFISFSLYHLTILRLLSFFPNNFSWLGIDVGGPTRYEPFRLFMKPVHEIYIYTEKEYSSLCFWHFHKTLFYFLFISLLGHTFPFCINLTSFKFYAISDIYISNAKKLALKLE